MGPPEGRPSEQRNVYASLTRSRAAAALRSYARRRCRPSRRGQRRNLQRPFAVARPFKALLETPT